MSTDNQHATGNTLFGLFGPAFEYMMDATQRGVLFCDVMRQRSNQYRDHLVEKVPNVLDYKAELVMDGRTLKRPVNYLLVRIVPPQGIEIDPARVGHSWWWIRARGMAQASVASRPTAKSASP